MKPLSRLTAATGLVPLFLLLVSALQAAEPPVSKGTLPLWKLSGESNTVYLLGSIHFCKPDFFPLPQAAENAYSNAATVVFEVHPAELESIATQLAFANQGMNPPGTTLAEQISEETYTNLVKWAEKELGGTEVLDVQRPWMAAMTLTVLEIQKLGFDPQQGIDQHFFRRAKTDRKRIIGLETAAFQIKLFTGLSKSDQELFLKSTLKDIGKLPEMFDDIIAAWKSGDTTKLEALLTDAMKEYPDIWKRLVLDRNRTWLTKVEKYRNATNDYFVVVGMGHLVGQDSLVDLLKQKGFKVEQQ